MNFEIFVMLVLHHIILIELGKAIIDKFVTVGFLQMLKDKFGEACEKCTRPLLLIDMFQEFLPSEGKTFVKLVPQPLGHCLPQIIDEKFLSNAGAGALIGQYPPQICDITNYSFTIVRTGVGACPHDACYAWLTAANRSACSSAD